MHSQPRTRIRKPSSAGFTLLESIIGICVVMIGVMAMTSTSFVAHSLQESNKTRRIAGNALQSMLDQVRSASEVARDADAPWSVTLLDIYGASGTPGSTFDVAGLSPVADGEPVGSLLIVTDETLADDEFGVALGMPRDLDGDGSVSNPDVSGSALLLPVIITLRWSGEAGDRVLVHGFYVGSL